MTADWWLTDCWLMADWLLLTDCLKIWARKMKIDCSRQVWHERMNGRMHISTSRAPVGAKKHFSQALNSRWKMLYLVGAEVWSPWCWRGSPRWGHRHSRWTWPPARCRGPGCRRPGGLSPSGYKPTQPRTQAAPGGWEQLGEPGVKIKYVICIQRCSLLR